MIKKFFSPQRYGEIEEETQKKEFKTPLNYIYDLKFFGKNDRMKTKKAVYQDWRLRTASLIF